MGCFLLIGEAWRLRGMPAGVGMWDREVIVLSDYMEGVLSRLLQPGVGVLLAGALLTFLSGKAALWLTMHAQAFARKDPDALARGIKITGALLCLLGAALVIFR